MLPNDALFSISHSFNPRQLTLARELRGLLKHELAVKVGKSPSAIGQFESGRARPEPQTIAALSLALGFPSSFFAYEAKQQPISADSCQFRSLRSSTVREQRYVLARGDLLKELAAFLEEEVDFPAVRVPHPPGDWSACQDIEDLAAHVRAELGLRDGPIGNIVNVLENAGIIVVAMDTNCRRIDAFSTWIGSRPYVFLNSHKESTSRTRFDAAHELGHLVMHADVVPGNVELERQADQFASAFLMPRSSFAREGPTRLNFGHLRELKQRWKTSLAALCYRAFTLGTFSQATLARAFVQMNKMGIRYNEPDEPAPEPPQLLRSALQIVRDAGTTDLEIASELGISERDLLAILDGSDLPPTVASPLPDTQSAVTNIDCPREPTESPAPGDRPFPHRVIS